MSKPTNLLTVKSLLENLPSLRDEDGGLDDETEEIQGDGEENKTESKPNEEEDLENLKQYDRSELLKIHHGVNPLYWFCVFQVPDLLEKALKKCDYQQWVYSKSVVFDPFLYSMRIKNKELIEVWADYFLKEGNENRLIVRDHDTLKMLLDSKSEKIQKLGISKLKGPSSIHRDIEPIKVCGFDKDKGYLYCFTRDCFIDTETKKKLKDKEDVSKEGVTVTHESTLIPLSKGLSKLFWLLSSVEKMAPQNKLELRPLFLALFWRYRWYFYIYSFFNALGNILFFIIIVFHNESWWLLTPFYMIYSFMTLFEIIDFINEGPIYFKSVYNWFDMVLYPAGMIVVGTAARDNYEYLSEEFPNFLVSLVLDFALLRSITMLRVIKKTRYLMLMLLRTYIDMTPFLVVLFLYVVGNGGIYMVSSHTNSAVEDIYTLKQLQTSSDLMYNWGFGNWENTDSMNDSNFIFYIHTGIFIGLVMFNLLIAIISGTYDEFVENRDMIDLEEIISMLSEMASFLRFTRKLKETVFGPSKERGVFYHFLIPYIKEEDDLKEILKKISNLEQGIKTNNNELKTKINKFRKELNSRISRITDSQREMLEETQNTAKENHNKMELKIEEILNLLKTPRNQGNNTQTLPA